MGQQLPAEIYAKHDRYNPNSTIDLCTPIYVNGSLNQEVLHFFSDDSQIISDLQTAAQQVYHQRDSYMQGHHNFQQQSNQYGYGQNYRRSINELSNDEYERSERQFTESSEFQEEEEVTEESEEQFNALTDNEDENDVVDDEGTEGSGHDQSSGEELEDIEQDIENVIDEVLDLRIIPFEDSWKYPPSLMVRPEPEDVWKFDGLRRDQPLIPRSDGGYIMERLKLLEDDLQYQGTNEPLTREMPEKDQPKVYIFLIKWRGSSHIHATWELEAHIQHLNSYVKVKKFKHQFIDRQSLLASEKLGYGYKDGLLEQLAEQQKMQKIYQIPERIVAFRNMSDKQESWNQSLQKVLETVKKQEVIVSDAFDGAFVKSASDNLLHYYNQYQLSQIDKKGYIVGNVSTGIDQLRGEMYLIKWVDLPYQECTWELYEDLVAHPSIGKELMKELRKQFKNSGKQIKNILQQTDYCRFGSRKPSIENNESHPSFLIDVTNTFNLRPYQIHGLNTLMYNWSNNRNMILCDPVNSGKTVQAIVFLSWLYHQQKVPGPFMIISSPSKMQSWQDHLATLFPDASVVVLYGSKEDRRLIIENELIADGLHRFHILLTTQSAAQVEEAHLRRFKWRMLIIDDAHIYREREGKRCRIFTSFTTDAKLLLTSQPLSSVVSEFYSLLHFIDPDQFHTQEIFTKLGQLEHFKDALHQCEIQQQDGAGEAQLMKSVVVPLQQVKQSVQTVDTGADDALIATNRDDMMLSSDEESGGMPQGQAPNNLQNTYAGATLMTQGGESFDEKVDNIYKIIRPYLLIRDEQTIQLQSKLTENDEKMLFVNMTNEQQKISKEILIVNQTILKNAQSETIKQHYLYGIIKQLQKISNHASIFRSNQNKNMTMNDIINGSGKFNTIMALLSQFKQQNNKVLVYTQTQETFSLMERLLELSQYKYQQLMDCQSSDTRSKVLSEFNKESSDQFVFLYVTRIGNQRQPLYLQSADKIIIIDADMNPFEDLNILGLCSRTGNKAEVIRLITRNSVDEEIADIATQRLIIDYGLIRPSTNHVSGDISILRHILQKGSESILNGTAVSKEEQNVILQNAKKLTYQHATDAEKQQLKEDQFGKNKVYDELFWQNKFTEMDYVQTSPVQPQSQITQNQIQKIYELGCMYCGSEFVTQQIDQLSSSNIAYVLQQLYKEAEDAIKAANVDCFNIPEDIYINYQGNKLLANPLFKAWLQMKILQAHFETNNFRMPRSQFEIATFAVNWGYAHDHRLLSIALKNGAYVSSYKQELIDEIVCDVELNSDDIITVLQQRLALLMERLLRIQPPEKFIQELTVRGLHTQVQFEMYNISSGDQKEEDLLKRFELSAYQFPFAKDQNRTTFTIELQQKIFKLCLHQLQKFFTQSRRERINSIITRFYDATKAKLHYDDLRGISVLSGSLRMKKKIASQYDRFDITDADEGLLFKLYIQILNIVYSKTAIISQQCDEHIMALRRRGQQELDNDTLVQEYVRDLFDYLYRLVWPTCGVQMLPTPFVLARICERNALDFDEGDIECGFDGDDIIVTMRREKNASVQGGRDIGANDIIGDYD